MAQRTLTASLLLLVTACLSAERNDRALNCRTHHDDRLRLSFDLPLDWQTAREGDAMVFSGPSQTETYTTTITLQATAEPEALDTALEQVMMPMTVLPDFHWRHREPVVVDTDVGLGYLVQGELHESLRIRQGVLFVWSEHLIDFSYAATPEVFAAGLPAFDAALSSLTLYDGR